MDSWSLCCKFKSHRNFDFWKFSHLITWIRLIFWIKIGKSQQYCKNIQNLLNLKSLTFAWIKLGSLRNCEWSSFIISFLWLWIEISNLNSTPSNPNQIVPISKKTEYLYLPANWLKYSKFLFFFTAQVLLKSTYIHVATSYKAKMSILAKSFCRSGTLIIYCLFCNIFYLFWIIMW